MATKHSKIMEKVVEEAGRCELCGSRRGLEAHHIIPTVCGGYDSEENLLCVCKSCHSKLTPTSILTSIGIHNTKNRNSLISLKSDILCFIWQRSQDIVDEGGIPLNSLCDALDEAVNFDVEPYVV